MYGPQFLPQLGTSRRMKAHAGHAAGSDYRVINRLNLFVAAQLAADRKGGRRRKATIVLLDETGFLLQPLNRRNWTPTEVRPQQYPWDPHDRLCVIGSLSISPRPRRLNLYPSR